jgi:hypothetical protein
MLPVYFCSPLNYLKIINTSYDTIQKYSKQLSYVIFLDQYYSKTVTLLPWINRFPHFKCPHIMDSVMQKPVWTRYCKSMLCIGRHKWILVRGYFETRNYATPKSLAHHWDGGGQAPLQCAHWLGYSKWMQYNILGEITALKILSKWLAPFPFCIGSTQLLLAISRSSTGEVPAWGFRNFNQLLETSAHIAQIIRHVGQKIWKAGAHERVLIW